MIFAAGSVVLSAAIASIIVALSSGDWRYLIITAACAFLLRGSLR